MRTQRRRDIIGRIEAISHDYQHLKRLVALARCELGWTEEDFRRESSEPSALPAKAAASAVALGGV